MKQMVDWNVRLEFKLEDLWVGVFWRRHKEELVLAARKRTFDLKVVNVWICVVPCIPLHITRTVAVERKVTVE